MASYRLREEDVTYIRKVATDYRERPTGYRAHVPIETIPSAYISKWYTLTNPTGPMLSREGKDTVTVATSRTEDSAKVVYMRSDVSIPYTEAASAQRAGVPIMADNVKRQLANMHNKIGQMVYTGLDQPYIINGMTEDGTDLGGTLDTVYTATAGEFIDHAAAWHSHMMTYNYTGPFTWMISTSLSGDAKLPYLDLTSQEAYMQSAFNCNIYYETAIATASFDASADANPIYQMEYTADDGIWIVFDGKVENMALQETGPPSVYINPELDRDTNSYRGFVIWQGTWRTTNNTAIGYMEDVDRVA